MRAEFAQAYHNNQNRNQTPTPHNHAPSTATYTCPCLQCIEGVIDRSLPRIWMASTKLQEEEEEEVRGEGEREEEGREGGGIR